MTLEPEAPRHPRVSTRMELIGAFRKMLIDRQADLKHVVIRTRTGGAFEGRVHLVNREWLVLQESGDRYHYIALLDIEVLTEVGR